VHLYKEAKAYRPQDGGDPVLYLTAMYDDYSSEPTRSVCVRALPDGSFLYTLTEQDRATKLKPIANPEARAKLFDWIRSLFPDKNVQLDLAAENIGYFEGTNSPVERSLFSLTGKAKTKVEAVQLYQQLRLAGNLLRAVSVEVSRREFSVTNPDWSQGARVLGDEVYLSDFVQDAAFREVTKFIQDHGDDVARTLCDVNVLVSKDSLRPVVTYKRPASWFGQTVMEKYSRTLNTVPLPHPLSELEIDSIDLADGFTSRYQATEHRRLEIPATHRPLVEVPFYRTYYREDMDLRKELFKLLDEWIRTEYRSKRSRTESVPAPRQQLIDHLAAIGLTIDDLNGKTPEEMKACVKKAYRAAIMAVHPDRNAQDVSTAEEMTKQVLRAKDFFEDEKHLQNI
jgi:hypothetical protein